MRNHCNRPDRPRETTLDESRILPRDRPDEGRSAVDALLHPRHQRSVGAPVDALERSPPRLQFFDVMEEHMNADSIGVEAVHTR